MTGFYRFEGDLFTKNEKLSLQVVMVMKKKQDMQQPNKRLVYYTPAFIDRRGYVCVALN